MSESPYGFTWGPLKVIRVASLVTKRRESWCLRVQTNRTHVDIYVSKTGFVRIFAADGKEFQCPASQA